MHILSLATFKIFLCTYFYSILMMMCLNPDLFEFILFGFHKTSWIHRLFSFPQWGKFGAIISFSSPSRTLMTQMLELFFLSHRSVRLSLFFPQSFSFLLTGKIISINLFSNSLTLSFSFPFCYWADPVRFLLWFLYFLVLKFVLNSSLYFLFLCSDFVSYHLFQECLWMLDWVFLK